MKNKNIPIATILGARPQFIKAALFSDALAAAGFREILIHTGQHYDAKMSDIFFSEMKLKAPDFHLGIGSAGQGAQTGRMLEAVEKVLLEVKPACVVVFGDTNSTLAGALAAAKLQIPIAHIEAGLRSYNREMPEELNRVVTDHLSTALFCPSLTAKKNLALEGIKKGVHITGDIMVDTIQKFLPLARLKNAHKNFGLEAKKYFLMTIHRPANTDNVENLNQIISACEKAIYPVLFPVHPRTRNVFDSLAKNLKNILPVEPVGYLDMLSLTENARAVLTDSGGLQKEALYLKTRCITLRSESEWPETLKGGWNQIVGHQAVMITKALKQLEKNKRGTPHTPYGRGGSAKKMTAVIKRLV